MVMKFMRPTGQAELRTIMTVTRGPGWADMDKYISREIGLLQARLVEATDPVAIHRTQGMILALQNIQALAQDAPALLEKAGG